MEQDHENTHDATSLLNLTTLQRIKQSLAYSRAHIPQCHIISGRDSLRRQKASQQATKYKQAREDLHRLHSKLTKEHAKRLKQSNLSIDAMISKLDWECNSESGSYVVAESTVAKVKFELSAAKTDELQQSIAEIHFGLQIEAIGYMKDIGGDEDDEDDGAGNDDNGEPHTPLFS